MAQVSIRYIINDVDNRAIQFYTEQLGFSLEIVRRIKHAHSFTVLKNVVITFARKYRAVGVLKLQLVYILIFSLYCLGVTQQQLASLYNRFIQ